MRRLGVGIALAGVLVVVAGGLWAARLRRGPAAPTGALEVAGLHGPVEILRDSMGVPHVWASDEHDLYFAQGYLHASDRLWQMELFRRLPFGNLSQVLGEAALPADRFMRTAGLGRAAAAALPAAGAATGALDAYATGVNAAVAGWEGPLPPEFVLLRARPGVWEPVHSVAMERIMAWDLSEYSTGLNLARARNALSDHFYRLVEPRYPAWGATILKHLPPTEADSPEAAVPGGTPRLGPPAGDGRQTGAGDPAPGSATVGAPVRPTPMPPLVDDALLASADVPAPARDLISAANALHASNAWVLGGARSRSGKPLLANDMHLALNHPNIWYLMGLHGPGVDVVGMTLPGAPGVVAGHNRAVAWGFTNAMLDDADLFVERVDPADSTRYLTPEGSEPFRVRTEVIEVKGGAADTLVVRETRHGPVVTPVEARAGGDLLSLRWVAHEPSSTAPALLGMNRAASVDEFLEALSGFTNAHQNVVFADTSGAWGYWMAGRVPLRRSGRPSTLPVPGWTGEYDWDGWLSFQEHPHTLAPDAGYVATANNRQGWDPVSALVTERWFAPFRAQRIGQLIEAAPLHDAASMQAMQMDVLSLLGLRLQPAAVAAFRAAGLEAEAGMLEAWDGRAAMDSEAAAVFFGWFEAVRAELRTLAYGEPEGFVPDRAVRRAMEGKLDGAEDLARRAAAAAGAGTAGRTWGQVHQLVLDHPLAAVPVAGRVLGFGKGPLPREGGPHTVNVAPYGGREMPYRSQVGPSQRHVADLADLDGAGGFILPGGQSGLGGSPHSWDQLARWRAGTLWRLPLSRDGAEAVTVERLTLRPAGGRP